MAFLFDDELWKLDATPMELAGIPEKLQSSFRLAITGKGRFDAQGFKDAFKDERSDVERLMDENTALLKEYGGLPVWELSPSLAWDLKRKQIEADLIHEAVNVYSMMGEFAPYLEATWFIFDEPQMDDILEKAGTSLEKPLFERLNIRPAVISDAKDQEKLFLARYEFPKYGADLIYPEAQLPTTEGKCLAWIDFLTGMHFGDIEMLMAVGEVTTKVSEFPVQQADPDLPVPPIPGEFFEETFGQDKTLHNLIWLESPNAEGLVDGIESKAKPENPHWWFRVNAIETQKWPYPGEFLGLGVRIFPNLPWSVSPTQPVSSPFLFSGMFMDTVFITSAHVLGVEVTDDGFCKVKVKWREQELWACPTDFAQYEEGDRVTIIKDVKSVKTGETWEDPDLWKFDEEIWRVVPITYYAHGFGEN